MIPDSVKDVINSRIDRLPASAQMVLKVASCFLDFFDKTILLAVFPVATNEPELVKEDIRLLVKEDFLEKKKKGCYGFKDIMYQKVVHSRILFAQRQELHKAIATHIENVFHSQLDQFYPYLVFHWSEVLKQQVHVPSTVAEKAVLYALKAADIVSSGQANFEWNNDQRCDPSFWYVKSETLLSNLPEFEDKERLYKSIQLHKASLRESGTDDSLFSLLRNLAILDWEKKNKFYEILMETATRREKRLLTKLANVKHKSSGIFKKPLYMPSKLTSASELE